jgi:hypothetical protein
MKQVVVNVLSLVSPELANKNIERLFNLNICGLVLGKLIGLKVGYFYAGKQPDFGPQCLALLFIYLQLVE